MSSPNRLLPLLGALLLGYALYSSHTLEPATPAEPAKPAKPAPAPNPRPKNPEPDCPRWPHRKAETVVSEDSHPPQLGGLTSPDGTTEALPLPADLHWPRNIASHGLGLCTFRSIDYAARFQNVPQLVDLPERMREAGIPGGGFPEKFDRIVQQFGSGTPYWNDTSKSWSILAAAIASKRIACVDYSGRDPHYATGIAHCVCVVGFSAETDWVAILDNNFPSIDQIVWMGRSEFSKRWGGWCYGLLAVTPGHCEGHFTEENWSPKADDEGTLNYGLEPKSFPQPGSSVLDGQPSTVDDILNAIGPEMKPIDVRVDHKMEPISFHLDPMTAALAGGAILLFAVFARKEV